MIRRRVDIPTCPKGDDDDDRDPSRSLSGQGRRGWKRVAQGLVMCLGVLVMVQVIIFLNLPQDVVNLVVSTPDQSELIQQLGLEPTCTRITNATKSALERAVSQKCRQTILDVGCRNEAQTLFPSVLTNQCPGDQESDTSISYLGCFQDSFEDRLLRFLP